ncbi:MAG: cation:proton antiporter, partial [Phycisphaeraceae bacterium]
MTLTTILAAAALALGLARWRRLPSVPLLIVAGIVLDGLGLLPERETLTNILLLGLAFVVFFVGSELDPRRVGGQARAAIGVGVAQFLLLGAIGFGVMRAAGFDWLTALYVALAITASSTLVVVTVLRQRQEFFEPFGRLVVGVVLVQDLLVVLLLPVLARVAGGPMEMVEGVAGTLGLVALAGVCVRWVSPWLLVRMKLDEESLLLAVLAILFVFIGLAHWLALPEVTGAFLAGVALSGFPVRGLVRGQVTSLADFFLAVFFVALGGLVSFPGARQMVVEG